MALTLDQAEATSDPVSLNSDEDLANDDATDLEIGNGINPQNAADFMPLPALRPHRLRTTGVSRAAVCGQTAKHVPRTAE